MSDKTKVKTKQNCKKYSGNPKEVRRWKSNREQMEQIENKQ